MDGKDEDNCHMLEYNECEENEYRCSNGLCIPEEYWLDGSKDCMDWSGERILEDIDAVSGSACAYELSNIDCEEHQCLNDE
ncbi:unnamed protein product, partial [Didymodactylos carnosus]